MPTKTTIPFLSKPVAPSPRDKIRHRSSHATTGADSPVQRLRGRIKLDDPEQIQQIIFDPSLEPV